MREKKNKNRREFGLLVLKLKMKKAISGGDIKCSSGGA